MHTRHTVHPVHKKGSNRLATPVQLPVIIRYRNTECLFVTPMDTETFSEKYYACTLIKLRKSRCLGVEITHNSGVIQCFLVYQNHHVFSYINRCPHTGVNLDWMPHQFLDNNNELIQCATHGALFTIDDGLCIRGPCVGDRLQKVENVIVNNDIYLIL